MKGGCWSPWCTCAPGLPHAALAELYSAARSTISRAIGEIRPLLAARGFADPDRPGLRLRTLADDFPEQVSAPPKKPKRGDSLSEEYAWREQRRRQSSARICVEHAHAELRQWCPLQRYTGRREDYAETDQRLADPPGQHTPTSIADRLAKGRGPYFRSRGPLLLRGAHSTQPEHAADAGVVGGPQS